MKSNVTTRVHWTQTAAGRAKLAARRDRKALNGNRTRAVAHDLASAVRAHVEDEEDEPTAPAEPKPLGLKVRNAIERLRAEFVSYLRDFVIIVGKRDELAVKFGRAFAMWKEETGGTLAAFVRLYDETVPLDVKGYKAHTAYQAADYLMRKVREKERANLNPAQRAARIAGAPVNPRRAFARLIASILPLLAKDGQDALATAIQERLHWSENQVTGLMEDAATETPLIVVKAPRGVHVDGEMKVTIGPEAKPIAA